MKQKWFVDAIAALDAAAEGDSNDAEIDAAQELKEAALALLRKAAARDIAVAELVDEFDQRNDAAWNENSVQFPRLLAEIHALIGDDLMAEVADAMDLKPEEVYEIFERATEEFEKIKPAARSTDLANRHNRTLPE